MVIFAVFAARGKHDRFLERERKIPLMKFLKMPPRGGVAVRHEVIIAEKKLSRHRSCKRR